MIIICLLKSERWIDRKRAATQLAKIKDEKEVQEVLPEMIKILEHDESEIVRAEIASSLSKMGILAEDAIPTLINAMIEDESKEVREWSTIAIGEMGSLARQAIPKLIIVMETDSSVKVQKNAIFALGKMGGDAKKAVPALKRFKKGNSAWWVSPIINQTIDKLLA